METILEKDWLLTPMNHQTHLKVPFELARSYEKLAIYFSYSPQVVAEALALKAISAALPRYAAGQGRAPQQFLPLENLLTLSVSKGARYLGCRHYKASEQRLVLTAEGSSLGYAPVAVTAGDWEVQIHNHCLVSAEIAVKLVIKGGA